MKKDIKEKQKKGIDGGARVVEKKFKMRRADGHGMKGRRDRAKARKRQQDVTSGLVHFLHIFIYSLQY